jgi:hypothetical protein
MTKPWPNSMYADGQVSPDPLAFFDPPTRSDMVRAHEMVAQSHFGWAIFAGAQALLYLPGIFQGALGQDFPSLVNWFSIICIASGACGHIVAFRIALKTLWSRHLMTAYKITAGPKLTARALAIQLALAAPAFCIFGFLVVGYIWMFTHYNVPRWTVNIVEVTAALSALGLFASLAHQHMKRAVDVAMQAAHGSV